MNFNLQSFNTGLPLRPFQLSGVGHIINRFNGRALIADEPGLGKTAQSLAVAAHYNEWPVVIVCPASLRLNWRNEIKTWLPNHVSVPFGEVFVITDGKCKIPATARIIISSYELAVKRILELALLRPSMIIVDESHNIKNPKAIRTRKLIPLCQAAKRCLCLTGTPLLNRPIELWSQLCALNFSIGSYWEYAKKYCKAHKGRFGWDVSGASNIADLNQKLNNGVMIRRLKADVLQELPDKQRVKLIAEGVGRNKSLEVIFQLCSQALEESHGNLEEAFTTLRKKKDRISGVLFEEYSRLAVAKSACVVDWIRNNASLESPVVVFAHHRALIADIGAALTADGTSFDVIVGDTKLEDRQAAVDAFQSGKHAAIILSITAASTGLTLTRSSNTLMAELPWSPGIALQAEDRIHRIGQKNAATIWYMVAENTLDDILWGMLSKKSKIAAGVLDGATVNTLEVEEESRTGAYWEIISTVLHALKADIFNPSAAISQ